MQKIEPIGSLLRESLGVFGYLRNFVYISHAAKISHPYSTKISKLRRSEAEGCKCQKVSFEINAFKVLSPFSHLTCVPGSLKFTLKLTFSLFCSEKSEGDFKVNFKFKSKMRKRALVL